MCSKRQPARHALARSLKIAGVISCRTERSQKERDSHTKAFAHRIMMAMSWSRGQATDASSSTRLPPSTIASSLSTLLQTQKARFQSNQCLPDTLTTLNHGRNQVNLPKSNPKPHANLLRLNSLQLYLRLGQWTNLDTDPWLPPIRLYMATCNPGTHRQSFPLCSRTSRLRRQYSM
jgi:hypothetical protein